MQQFLFFVDNGYAHVSLLYVPLVMLFVPHCLLAQAHFCGRTNLPPSPNSTTSIGQGDIPIITLLILSSVGYSCLNIRWYTAPVGMMTFRWSLRSYQCISQQHPLYSHMQVTLIYYIHKSIYSNSWPTNLREKTYDQFKWVKYVAMILGYSANISHIKQLNPVSWGCRIQRLNLFRQVRFSQWVYWCDNDDEANVKSEL